MTVLDCPSAPALAAFYAELLGWRVFPDTDGDGTWVEIGPQDGDAALAFQGVEDFRAPEWPGQEHPQQMHLDVDVDDLEAGEEAVLALGATLHPTQPGTSFRVFLDPAGHPFCLCLG